MGGDYFQEYEVYFQVHAPEQVQFPNLDSVS